MTRDSANGGFYDQRESRHLPIGIPLSDPLFDEHGAILLRAGSIIASEQERSFLLEHFRIYPAAVKADPVTGSLADGRNPSEALTLVDMQLSIGGALGIRSQTTMSGPMRPSRVIGFSQNQALFVMPPGLKRQATTLAVGENVQAVAIGAQGIFTFVCTVEAVCHQPFDYIVLSAPGAIRQLRERRALRVRIRQLVEYLTNADVDALRQFGMASDLSAHGMSLLAPQVIGKLGARVQVSFPVKTQEVDVQFTTEAVIRNVRNESVTSNLVVHGLEFDNLGAEQQTTLRSFLFEKMTANWT